MLTLVWSEDARNDVREAIAYIAERNTRAAERLGAAIEAYAERLPDHPFMHRLGRVPGTREAVIHPNYILVYRVTERAVEILALNHSRQEYPEAVGRHSAPDGWLLLAHSPTSSNLPCPVNLPAW